MSRRSSTPLLVVVAVLVGLAFLALYFGEPLIDMVKTLHGGGH